MTLPELIEQANLLNSRAKKFQTTPYTSLSEDGINNFKEAYDNWYEECLPVLPEDLRNKFRSYFQKYIQLFLKNPTSIKSMFIDGEFQVVLVTPYETYFREPIIEQKTLLIDAMNLSKAQPLKTEEKEPAQLNDAELIKAFQVAEINDDFDKVISLGDSHLSLGGTNKEIILGTAHAYYKKGSGYSQQVKNPSPNIDSNLKKELSIKAIIHLVKAIQLNPNHADSYFWLGESYEAKGDSEKAIANLRKATELDPNNAKYHYHLGLAFPQDVGKHNEIIANFTRSLELDPGNHSALLWRGVAFMDKGDLISARRDLQQAVKMGNVFAQGHLQKLESKEALQPMFSTTPQAVETITKLASRFFSVAKYLEEKRRKENGKPKETIRIQNEYDVQDLFIALLHLEFNDIRPEEPISSFAGVRPRVDVYLGIEQIFIEFKKTRKSLGKIEIRDQLLVDKAHYTVANNCKTLIAIVYDEERLIDNIEGFIRDLSTPVNNKEVKVLVIQH